jgi:two-component system phosphate regulon sensor histidine kinase PhoR
MKQSKNKLALLLLITSVGLLMLLQFFWLKSSYEKAFFDLRKERSMILKGAVFTLRDSLFVKSIEPVNMDSPAFGIATTLRSDSVNVKVEDADSHRVESNIRILITSAEKADSSMDFLKPLASSMPRLDKRRSFILRMGPDTLKVDVLKKYYAKALRAVDNDMTFNLRHIFVDHEPSKIPHTMDIFNEADSYNDIEKPFPYADTLVTERVNLNPMHAYSAIFPAIRARVTKAIAPQILFSAFLTVIVAASFIVMYHNLRSQQRLNDLKNDFISNITHELKTPVTTVSVALEALNDFHVLDNPERTQEYLSIAQTELSRLTLMTDKILKASVMDSPSVSFISEPVDLHAIIQQVLSSMKLIFQREAIVATYEQNGNGFKLKGSEIHLTNVIYNLLDNAVKYSARNSAIHLQLTSTSVALELSIRDRGIGIAKEYRKRIFERFFRVPTGDVHNVKGYGLGLSYVAGVVEKHGGRIEVESEEGEGSKFIIRLPK